MLHTGPHAGLRVRMRETRGRDEILAAEGETADLLRQLLVPMAIGDLAPEHVLEVTASDRDRIVALLYADALGDAVECRSGCERCSEPFEVELSIRNLCERVYTVERDPRPANERGEYTTAAGSRFRLPTIGDLAALAGLPRERLAAALAERCVLHASADDDVEELIAATGPLLDLDLSATCPTCEAPQSVRFEIQRFFQSSMARERRWLTREVHRIAVAYSWRLTEILDLPRSVRREHVALIEAEGVGARRRA